jgi:hypothetical protein
MVDRLPLKKSAARAVRRARPKRLLDKYLNETSLRRDAARLTRLHLAAGLLEPSHGVSVETRKVASRAIFRQFCARHRFFVFGRPSLPNIVMVFLLAILLYSPLILSGLFIWRYWPNGLQIPCIILALTTFFVQMFALLAMLIAERAEGFAPKLLAGIQICSILVLVGAIVGVLCGEWSDGLYGASAVAIGTIAFAGTYLVAAPIAFAMTVVPVRVWRSRNPSLAVQFLVARCLDSLTQADLEWNDRRRLLADLDYAARLMAASIPARLGLKSPADDLAISRFRRSAGLLQSYRGWLATPNSGTSRSLFDELERVLHVVDSGCWDLLPSAEDEYLETGSGGSIVRDAAKCLFALIPLGCVGLLALLGIDLGPAAGYVTALSLLWAAIGFVATWHPSWASELGEARETLREMRRG